MGECGEEIPKMGTALLCCKRRGTARMAGMEEGVKVEREEGKGENEDAARLREGGE